jgi:formamidopyrimidine-DNA glycosylase
VPELPEVETIVRELAPHLQGRRILNVEVDWARTIEQPQEDIDLFCATLRGLRITAVTRRAKYVLLHLAQGDTDAWGACLVHLRMSGRLVMQPTGRPEHLRVTWHLSGPRTLYFYNMRKFGRVWLTRNPEQVLSELGPEPLSASFTLPVFEERISHRRGMLKPLLLNQQFIAGLGNIYADESLFRARLHPMRKADTLDREDVRRLYEAIQATLRQAIAHHGTTFDGLFVRPDGETGRQQEGLNVYGQTDLPCTRCGTPVERITVGQRGTHFCPVCQPVPDLT